MSKITKKIAMLSSTALLAIGTAQVSLADDDDFPRLESALNASKITLVQAIDIATQKQAGTVVEADFHPHRKGNPFYEVEILTSDKQLKELRIDAVTSEVIRNEVKDTGCRDGDRHHRRSH
ncbi:peptidase [Gallibacterium anatis]|uniref:PepSY domain-containing protein n=1 Tax=Gallibacterium anatis TaxID=750 RepID=UPI00053182EF|nr:PepSY domain-containing protein [Gallibacterium anatis]KGQ35827.1 peptidase [Gallibacterium anatis]